MVGSALRRRALPAAGVLARGRRRVLALACLLALLAAAPAAGARPAAGDVNVMLDKPEALAALFPEADEVLERRHVLSRAQLNTIEDRLSRRLDEGGFYLYRARRDGHLLGHAVVVSQIGKVRPITHIVEILPDGTVGTVAVMIYRESHGDEVAAPTFMEQYRGKGLDDPIRVDRDIINIAGATLSAHAICRGVRKALIVVDELCVGADEAFWSEAGDVTPPALQPDRDLVTSLDGGTALRIERQVMGTICRVEAYLEDSELDAAGLEAACRAALDEVSRWDDVLSTWRDDTPLARLNATPVSEPFSADPDLLAWLEEASRWRDATASAFDPAVGALVEAWGLRTGTPCRPSPERQALALAASGLDLLSRDGGQISRGAEGLQLDPGACGKGWALDRAAAVLAERGVTRALLSFRSTLLALGPPPGHPAWTLPVAHDGPGEVVTTVSLSQGALSVSGGALRGFDDDGVLRGHVIDPRSGEPVPAGRLAWVRHASASASDALATALLVDGADLAAVAGATGGWMADAKDTPRSWPSTP